MSKNGKKKKFSLKDFNKLQKQKDKAKYQLAEMKKKSPHLQQRKGRCNDKTKCNELTDWFSSKKRSRLWITYGNSDRYYKRL